MPVQPRPAMYRLVITVLFAALVIFLAMGVSAVFLIIIFQDRALLISIVPFAVAAGLFYIGIRSLTVVVCFLRGKQPGKHWERWVFSGL